MNLSNMMIPDSEFDAEGNISALAEGLAISEVLKADRERIVAVMKNLRRRVIMLQAHKDLPCEQFW